MKISGILLSILLGIFGISGDCFSQDDWQKPNIILIMADDLGWGDVGFNGNTAIKTPELDEMAAGSIQFTRFYAASPVCSPTRGSVLTGRHPERYGIFYAGVMRDLKEEEVTLAEVLKTQGYTTGHFGKWHLGTLTKTTGAGWRDEHRRAKHYSPPWENGFDVSFSTEQSVPTWDPMKDNSRKYWTGSGEYATENLEGDDSRVIMDRVIPFIEQAAEDRQPFLSVVWFHTPHAPVVAGPEYRQMYSRYSENKQHYYGVITAMDEQIGRLRRKLRSLKIADNTIVFFASDNGPAGIGGGVKQEPGGRQQGSPGPFRGRKGGLYEGGIRVPALMEWPAKIKSHRKVRVPVSTLDYYPTILAILGISIDKVEGQPLPLDGSNIMPIVNGTMHERPRPLAFRVRKQPFTPSNQRALINDQFKIYSSDNGKTYELYDLLNDPGETKNIAAQYPEKVREMAARLEAWIESCEQSNTGADYN